MLAADEGTDFMETWSHGELVNGLIELAGRDFSIWVAPGREVICGKAGVIVTAGTEPRGFSHFGWGEVKDDACLLGSAGSVVLSYKRTRFVVLQGHEVVIIDWADGEMRCVLSERK